MVANMKHFRLCVTRERAMQESDGCCEGSDAEMIGNGRRGAGERDRDLEEDDELESREERSSESGGGGGGGFGGWRSHLLGGLTQRVKSWYWGARPLVSFPIHKDTISFSLFFFSFHTRTIFSLVSVFLLLSFLLSYALSRYSTLCTVLRKDKRTRSSGKGNISKKKSDKFRSKIKFGKDLRNFLLFSIWYTILILFNFLNLFI